MIYKILELNAEINTWYRSSKLPKLIKKCIAKFKRFKLTRIIYKYTDVGNHMLESSDIYNFFRFAVDRVHDKSIFKYVDSISLVDIPSDFAYFASLSFKDKNDRGICRFSFREVTSKGFLLNIKLEDDRGLRTLATIQCNEKGLSEIPIPIDKTTMAVIRGLNTMISDMIDRMLIEELKRSERIYDI